MQLNKSIFEPIIKKPFFQDILANEGNIFFIGGAVRDMFLEKKPKDIDLIVQHIEFDKLISILKQFGTVKLAGESFGVIMFKEIYSDFACEIALPRIDSLDKTKKGHKAIVAQSDHDLPIEIDLKRRDFTVNSIAISHEFNITDPFNGLTHLKNKVIKATDDQTFIDDPLRLIRALQFAARFSFMIDEHTFKLIKENAHLIKTISSERILMEFQKVIDKGDWIVFLNLLNATGLWYEIFGFAMKKMIGTIKPTTLSELLYLAIRGEDSPIKNWGEFFDEELDIDNKTQKELRALEIVNDAFLHNLHLVDNKKDAFKALQICPWALSLPYFEFQGIDKQDFERKILPKSFRDLEVNGDDMLKLGFEGKEIGEMNKKIVDAIFENKLINDRKKILKFIKDGRKT